MSTGMDQQTEPDRQASLLQRLRRRRRAARLVLLFEKLWPALWPPLGVAGLFLCLALLGAPQSLPPWPHALLLLVFAAAFIVLLVRGLAGVRVPDDAAADRRLEREAGLKHRPLAALTDRPAFAGGEALWRAHVARAARQVRTLRAGLPRPGLPARDKRALRGGLVVALVAAGAIAGGDAPDRVAHAFSPGFPPRQPPPAPILQAWITPPTYTGVAPLFLRAGDRRAITVPAGSHLTVSLTGGSGRPPSLLLNGHPETFRALDPSSFQADRNLTSGGRLAVRRNGRELAGWDLSVVADQPPTVRWAEPPGQGQHLAVRLPWQVGDDYGVSSLRAELRLRARPDAPPVVLDIPLAGTPKEAHGTAYEDLTANPWAGLAVTARLVARDSAGQQAASDDAAFTLPEREFHNPVARAVIAARKGLSLHPEARREAEAKLDDVSAMPQLFGTDLGAYLNLRAIASLLRDDAVPTAVAEAQGRMWELALHMEETAVERTARALEQARQALHDAMQRRAKGEHVDPKQLDKLMQQLQQALRAHLQALAQQLRQDQSGMPADPNAERLDARAMERLAQKMREAAEAGRMDEARAAERELERMLQELKQARREHATGSKSAQRQKARQGMSALQDMVQREGHLLDHAQARENAQKPSATQLPGLPQLQQILPQLNQGSPQESDQGEQSPQQRQAQAAAQAKANGQRTTDREVQRALRRALGELMQQFSDMTGKLPPSLGDADRAMEQSAQALAKGNDPVAGGAQERAIQALQKGGAQMRQQMAKMFGRQKGGQQQGEQGDSAGLTDGETINSQGEGEPMPGEQGTGQQSTRRDPFGRLLQNGSSGADESGSVTLPKHMEQARSRAIERELRRRASDRERPKEELDYIGRLLKQF